MHFIKMAKSTKAVKKKWIKIVAPKEFKNQVVGETLVSDPQKAIGRVIEANLFELTRDPRKQSVRLSLIVNEIKNDQAYTEIKKYKILDTHLKRLIKPGKEKVMDYFNVQTKDKKLRIKLFLLTRNKTTNATCTALRKEARKYLEDYAKKIEASRVISDIIAGNVLRTLKTYLKKIYPVNICEISTMEIIK